MKRASVPSLTSLVAGHLKSGALKSKLKPKRKTKPRAVIHSGY